MKDSRLMASWRMERVWPGAPTMTSWCARRPGRRTLCTETPSISPPRVAAMVSLSVGRRVKGLPRASTMARAVAMAVPDGASAFSSWCISMISAWSKKRAATRDMWTMSTAPREKLGATTAPTWCLWHSAETSSISRGERPVVPMTRSTPRSAARRAAAMVASPAVKSTRQSG